MKLFIRTYNDSCACHPEIRHQIVFAKSKEDAEMMAYIDPEKRVYDFEEYEIQEGFVTEVG